MILVGQTDYFGLWLLHQMVRHLLLSSLFDNPAASCWRPLGFAPLPRDGFAFIAALLEEDAPTLL